MNKIKYLFCFLTLLSLKSFDSIYCMEEDAPSPQAKPSLEDCEAKTNKCLKKREEASSPERQHKYSFKIIKLMQLLREELKIREMGNSDYILRAWQSLTTEKNELINILPGLCLSEKLKAIHSVTDGLRNLIPRSQETNKPRLETLDLTLKLEIMELDTLEIEIRHEAEIDELNTKVNWLTITMKQILKRNHNE